MAIKLKDASGYCIKSCKHRLTAWGVLCYTRYKPDPVLAAVSLSVFHYLLSPPHRPSTHAPFHIYHLIFFSSLSHYCFSLSIFLLPQVISPKPRTDKWVPTSVGEELWDSPQGRSSSAEFHANNLVSPVLFYEALQKVSLLSLQRESAHKLNTEECCQ